MQLLVTIEKEQVTLVKVKYLTIFIFSWIGLRIVGCGLKHNQLGEKYAKEFLESVKKGEGSLLAEVVPLIKDRETAVAIAETVLFKVYGKENIIDQRPYEVYKLENYWVLMGTLPQGYVGGTFEIAIDAKDGKIIGLNHGK